MGLIIVGLDAAEIMLPSNQQLAIEPQDQAHTFARSNLLYFLLDAALIVQQPLFDLGRPAIILAHLEFFVIAETQLALESFAPRVEPTLVRAGDDMTTARLELNN